MCGRSLIVKVHARAAATKVDDGIVRSGRYVIFSCGLAVITECAREAHGTSCLKGKHLSWSHPSAEFADSGLPGSRFGFFVQFPHPGVEHQPSTDAMTWNLKGHGRKFMVAKAKYLDSSGSAQTGEAVFWGEWEPPSDVVCRWPRSGAMPRALHRPFWDIPQGTNARQNTDPRVFGDQMIFSNCRQGTMGRPSRMQRLTPGSVICFGSTLGGAFCVDTVFVVESVESWSPRETADLGAGEAFQICAAESLCLSARELPKRLTLYRGATLDRPVNGMYCFVPCLPADAPDPRFPRPAVKLHRLIDSASTRGPRQSRSMAPEAMYEAWDSIRQQICQQGLRLATWVEAPPRRPGTAVPM